MGGCDHDGLRVGHRISPLQLMQKHKLVQIGSYPFYRDGRPGVSVVLRGTGADDLEAARAMVQEQIVLLGETPMDED